MPMYVPVYREKGSKNWHLLFDSVTGKKDNTIIEIKACPDKQSAENIIKLQEEKYGYIESKVMTVNFTGVANFMEDWGYNNG